MISHISRSFPADPLPSFHVEQRLFVDTSSLLPNADTSLRRYTHLLNLSHSTHKTYIGTSVPRDRSRPAQLDALELSIITVPEASLESFTELLVHKLQPQWSHRQSLTLKNGTSLALQNGDWTIRIGDLRMSNRSTQGAGSLRGMLVEASYLAGSSSDNDADGKADEIMLRSFLDTLLRGTGAQIEGARVMFRRTRPAWRGQDGNESDSTPDWALASLYMDVLRGSRG